MTNLVTRPELNSAPIEICLGITEELTKWQHIEKYTRKTDLLLSSDSFPWSSTSLYNGYPSLILLFTHLQQNFPHLDLEASVLDYVRATNSEIQKEGIFSLSLFSGFSGLCFSVYHAAKCFPKLSKLNDQLHNLLIERIKKSILPLLQSLQCTNTYVDYSKYDLISGVIGIGAYLLVVMNVDERALSILQTINAFCLSLVEKNERSAHFKCFRPASQLQGPEKEIFPLGNYNLGLSHGMSGILAFLSKSYLKGVRVTGQLEKIQRLSEFVNSASFEYESEICWPVRYHHSLKKSNPMISHLFRLGWCDGSSGILASILLSAKVLQDKKLTENALRHYEQLTQKHLGNGLMSSPTLCHGYSGLKMINSCFMKSHSSHTLREIDQKIDKAIYKTYEAHFPLGFQDICHANTQIATLNSDLSLKETIYKFTHFSKLKIPQLGLLNGVAGVLLSLLLPHTKNNFWTNLFLITDAYD